MTDFDSPWKEAIGLYFAPFWELYNDRIFDRYNRDVVSVAVLGDDRTARFGSSGWCLTLMNAALKDLLMKKDANKVLLPKIAKIDDEDRLKKSLAAIVTVQSFELRHPLQQPSVP